MGLKEWIAQTSELPRPLRGLLGRAWRVPATRPDPNFFLLPEPDLNYFSKSPSLGFFSGRLFPSTPLKPFTIILKFCYFLVFPTQNPLFLNQNVLDTRDESKESQKNLTIDLFCILIYSSRGNQIQDLFTSTNYFLKKPMLFSNLKLHLTTTRSSTFSGFSRPSWGWPHCRRQERPAQM